MRRREGWYVLGDLLTVGSLDNPDRETRQVFTVTPWAGAEPAFHPMYNTRDEAHAVCDALNELGWSEDDYLDRSHKLNAAVSSGKLDTFVKRHTRRRFSLLRR